MNPRFSNFAAFALLVAAAISCRPHAPAAAAKHEKQFTNSIGMKFTLIPAGEFVMGSTETPSQLLKQFDYAKPVWLAGERPRHKVRITKPFYLGTYEVTLGQFRKFRDDTNYKCDCETDGDGGWGYTGENGNEFQQLPKFTPWSWGFEGQTNNHPVVNVSWNDADAFCKWLSHKEGKTYRLPTEAQWEYAARAGTKTRYYCGDDPERLAEYENVQDRTGAEKFTWWKNGITASDGFAFTAPVGSFHPNAFGLYDMLGNVGEWCGDWYREDYYATYPPEDPTGPDTGATRVFRGGSWANSPVICRSATRIHGLPTSRVFNVGFRVVCEQ